MVFQFGAYRPRSPGALATGNSVEGMRATTADDLRQAVTAALGSQTPTMIEEPTLAERFLTELAMSTKPVDVEDYRSGPLWVTATASL
jgi:hypothetical protein